MPQGRGRQAAPDILWDAAVGRPEVDQGQGEVDAPGARLRNDPVQRGEHALVKHARLRLQRVPLRAVACMRMRAR